MQFFYPLHRMILALPKHPEYRLYLAAGLVALAFLLLALVLAFRKYFTFIFKSLFRNKLRTLLSSAAIFSLVMVVTLIWSVLMFLDIVMEDKSTDLKAIVTERWQIPSQMPISYGAALESGAPHPDDPHAVKPTDSMTWQFYGGTTEPDPAKRNLENIIFFFAMDPHKIKPMMDDLEGLDERMIEAMVQKKAGVLIGRDRAKSLNKRVGERFVLQGLNYPDMKLEFEVVGILPEGRYDQSAIMNRDYLNDTLDAWPRLHNGQKHSMADKSLNLVWLRVADKPSYEKLADQIVTSSLFTAPAVKCETASSGIASFLDSYKDILQGMKWLLVPAILITMSLVIANAISISVRERRTEMAVLKVLGYGPGRIQAFVLGEALLIGICSGLASAALAYFVITVWLGGFKFPIAFFPSFEVFADALWWGPLVGGLASLAGSFFPALSARRVKVSEVFSKIG